MLRDNSKCNAAKLLLHLYFYSYFRVYSQVFYVNAKSLFLVLVLYFDWVTYYKAQTFKSSIFFFFSVLFREFFLEKKFL